MRGRRSVGRRPYEFERAAGNAKAGKRDKGRPSRTRSGRSTIARLSTRFGGPSGR